MSIPWPPATTRGRKLTVYSTLARRSPVWNHVLGHALADFNALSKKSGLGIQLKPSDQPPRDGGGADIAINTGDGKVSVSFPGADPESDTFDGKRMHGSTLLLSRQGVMLKAFIFLPAHPEVNTPSGPRLVGSKVLTLIAVHELIHACGLENGDHGKAGVFQPTPFVAPGDTAAGDMPRVQPTVDRYMPPYELDDQTVNALKSIWTTGA
jgi:hypothetical protein